MKNQLATSNNISQAGTVELNDQNETFTEAVIILACYLVPKLPGIIKQVLEIPHDMMEHGYGLDIKKGDFELKFGKGLFQSNENQEVRHGGDS